MVAENSMVCRTAGVCAMIFSMSGRKPRSSILSASSSTISLTFFNESRRCEARSSSRPGVPTTICAPALSCSIWPFVRLAAVDRHDLRGPVRGGELEVLGHLHAELAGRHDDERLDAALGVVAEALDDREAEPEGLAGAGLRLADDVLAREGEGDGLFLDGEGIDDALPGEGVDDVGRDAEVTESGQYSACRYCGKRDALCFYLRRTVAGPTPAYPSSLSECA